MLYGMILLYGGPDQIMTVTSGLASLVGVLLLFWNRIVGTIFRVLGLSKKSDAIEDEKAPVPSAEKSVSSKRA
jgi:undecaprenyl pyrophosphate phosphatase UppP